MINITPRELKIVQDILQLYVANCEVRVFGSRYCGNVKPYSDLDLVIIGQQKLDIQTLYKLKDAFEESELPFRVDILDWHSTSDEFKQIINQGYETLQK